MSREELLARLVSLRQARVGQVRVPHKPLLLLWLFGQFAATGSSAASYQQAGEPVSQLINDFGPPVASAAAARQRAAMPFVLQLSSDNTRVLVEVWDADPQPPAPNDLAEDGTPDLQEERGRGLFLVTALSSRWDWYPTREPPGKVVWCELEPRSAQQALLRRLRDCLSAL